MSLRFNQRFPAPLYSALAPLLLIYQLQRAMTQLNTPKSYYRERTGTEWFVSGLGLGLVVSVNPNPNLTLKLTTRLQSFLGNLILEYPV